MYELYYNTIECIQYLPDFTYSTKKVSTGSIAFFGLVPLSEDFRKAQHAYGYPEDYTKSSVDNTYANKE